MELHKEFCEIGIAELAILNITNKNDLNVLKLCLINRIWGALTFDIYKSLLTLIEIFLKDILWVDNINTVISVEK